MYGANLLFSDSIAIKAPSDDDYRIFIERANGRNTTYYSSKGRLIFNLTVEANGVCGQMDIGVTSPPAINSHLADEGKLPDINPPFT